MLNVQCSMLNGWVVGASFNIEHSTFAVHPTPHSPFPG
jgi:hypothetical protein